MASTCCSCNRTATFAGRRPVNYSDVARGAAVPVHGLVRRAGGRLMFAGALVPGVAGFLEHHTLRCGIVCAHTPSIAYGAGRRLPPSNPCDCRRRSATPLSHHPTGGVRSGLGRTRRTAMGDRLSALFAVVRCKLGHRRFLRPHLVQPGLRKSWARPWSASIHCMRRCPEKCPIRAPICHPVGSS